MKFLLKMQIFIVFLIYNCTGSADDNFLCGNANPLMGYGPGPYGGSWSGQHRDGRNSDWADCEIGDRYKYSKSIMADEPHTTFSQPIIAPDNSAWLVVSLTGRSTITINSTFIYRVNTSSGKIIVRLGPMHGLNRTVSWNAPVVDKEGNIYLGQELQRSPYVPCRFHGEEVHNGILCGEFMSFDSAGNLRWKVRTDGGTLGAQFTNDGKLVLQTWRGTIYIINPESKVDNRGRIIGFLNSFPESAKTLMDYPTNEVVTECLYKAQNDKCISANIVAVSPQTGAIYNTVQGFVKGVTNSFLQRWNYDEKTNKVTIDSQWNSDVNLIGGCPSSPDISFDGKLLFVHDLDGNIFALDSDSGDMVHSAKIGYVPVGSSTTAPEFDNLGNLIGTYITFQRAMDLEGEFIPYVRIMRYKKNEGFKMIAVLDGSDEEPGWIARRNPVGGLTEGSDKSGDLRFLTIATMYCEGCEGNGDEHLLVIDPYTGVVISSTKMEKNLSGTFSLGSDKSVVISPKPDADGIGSIRELVIRYDSHN